MKELAGRAAVVTGASRGIGVYIAKALAAEGMNLVLAARSAGPLEDLRAELTARAKGGVTVAPVDLAGAEGRQELVARATAEYGAIEVLVNNAGIENVFTYHKLPWPEIEAIVQLNLVAAMHLTWLALPRMLERGRGHIVNISSLAGKAGPACAEPYAATKAALVAFTQSLRASYRDQGVSASAISPGFVDAGMYDRARFEVHGRKPPTGVAPPEAVAEAVVRSIKGDTAEIIVNPRPVRPLMAMNALMPGVTEKLSRMFDSNAMFREEAAMREREREAAKQASG
jgi:short-subunit dehydrogenase